MAASYRPPATTGLFSQALDDAPREARHLFQFFVTERAEFFFCACFCITCGWNVHRLSIRAKRSGPVFEEEAEAFRCGRGSVPGNRFSLDQLSRRPVPKIFE